MYVTYFHPVILINYPQLHKPAAQVKKDTQWTWEVVTDRLRVVGLNRFPINLDDTTLNFMFKREYLHRLYGGNQQATFSDINAVKAAVHGIKRFACLVLEYNPHAPVVPGNPGLFFSNSVAIGRWDEVERVIVRIRNTTPALWQYMGEYRMYPSESLTPEEYKSQPLMVRTLLLNA